MKTKVRRPTDLLSEEEEVLLQEVKYKHRTHSVLNKKRLTKRELDEFFTRNNEEDEDEEDL